MACTQACPPPQCDLLGCDIPILPAGIGCVSGWELAAAVASAVGYPTLGMVREAADLIEREVRALRAATDRPFAVNLIPAATHPDLLDVQIASCLALGSGTFSFFWHVVPSAVERVKATRADAEQPHELAPEASEPSTPSLPTHQSNPCTAKRGRNDFIGSLLGRC